VGSNVLDEEQCNVFYRAIHLYSISPVTAVIKLKSDKDRTVCTMDNDVRIIEVKFHSLTSALDGSECIVACRSHPTSAGRTAGAFRIGSLGGP
jgi:hypothetical protein